MTVTLCIGILHPDLLLRGFREQVFLPLELLGTSHCQYNSNPDNEMPEVRAHRPAGDSQEKLVTQGLNFQFEELCLEIPD